MTVHCKCGRRFQSFAVLLIDHKIPVQQLDQLSRKDRDDFITVFRAIEQLVGIKEYARAVGSLGRLACIVLQPDGKRSGDVSREEHDCGAMAISRSVSVDLRKKRCLPAALRPRTILVTPDKRANSAI